MTLKSCGDADQLRRLDLVAAELLDGALDGVAVLRVLVLDDADRHAVDEKHQVGAVALARRRLERPLPGDVKGVGVGVLEVDLMKPTIRLAKYWNAKVGYVFDSFSFEKWTIQQSYFSAANQRDYLFEVIDSLSIYSLTEQWRKDRVQRAKDIVAKVRQYERDEMPYSAEGEVKKLIPES